MTTIDEAYAACEQITRTEARNFSYGIRLLPTAKRRALSAVYALARRIDDIGDEPGEPGEDKITALEGVRAQVADLDAQTDVVLVALADAARRFPLPLRAFSELVDGVEADVRGITYDTFDELVGYCRLVAGTVGRLCLGVYGADDLAVASVLADDLGVALQQTNVLRDIREDLLTGRTYLPAKELADAGLTLSLDGLRDPAFAAYVRSSAARAQTWYDRGLPLLSMLDRRSAACTAAMAGIYVRLNRRITRDPAAVTTGRVSLPAGQKAAVAARALLTGGV
jgi:phytoene synthase